MDEIVEKELSYSIVKAASEIAAIHKQQAFSYLKATGLQLALVMNFGTGRLQVARVVVSKQRKISSHQTGF